MKDFNWQHIRFTDGSNPYICMTEKEFKRIQKKYNLTRIDENFWLARIVSTEDLMMDNNYFEAIEICPHCDAENVYPMWDVNIKGYIAICEHCGKEIFLCDECMHSEDNEGMSCDWCKTDCGGKCFRGITKD